MRKMIDVEGIWSELAQARTEYGYHKGIRGDAVARFLHRHIPALLARIKELEGGDAEAQ